MHVSRTFARQAAEVPHARHYVAAVLEQAGLETTDEVLLVTSELVSNAVVHGAGRIELHLTLDGDLVHLEVCDEGARVPSLTAMPAPDATGGRGLPLVDRMSRAWGTGLDARGRTRVWADLAAPLLRRRHGAHV